MGVIQEPFQDKHDHNTTFTMRVLMFLVVSLASLASSAPQFGFGRFGFGNRGGGNSFRPSQNCIGGNCQQNNQNVNFNSGFGGNGRGFGGGRGNSFGPRQNCFRGNCQQNNQNINFNNPLFGK